jgi:serine/threonine protein kinase
MEGSFKLPKLVPKQKKDLELPRFDWASIAKQKKLGSGSFGSVYLAKHAGTSQNVVVKKLKSVSIDSQTRFVKEAKILNSVKGHRNIKQIFRIL